MTRLTERQCGMSWGMYGINGQLLKVVQSLYEKSEACVTVSREEGEQFEVDVGLRQG